MDNVDVRNLVNGLNFLQKALNPEVVGDFSFVKMVHGDSFYFKVVIDRKDIGKTNNLLKNLYKKDKEGQNVFLLDVESKSGLYTSPLWVYLEIEAVCKETCIEKLRTSILLCGEEKLELERKVQEKVEEREILLKKLKKLQ